MRAGCQVVLRDSVDHQQQWRDHLEQFRAARDVGFDTYCWAHHYLIDPFQHFQPFPVLARLAGEPGDMKLATSVLLLPLLNPVDVAEQVATLDQISEGRFILGLGLGYRPEECEAFGIRMSQRGARHSEALALMQRLWTEDEVTHHGRYFQVSNARPTARPYQKPHPKIWEAAMSDPAVRRVGREGHILFIGPAQPFETIRHQIESVPPDTAGERTRRARGDGYSQGVFLRREPPRGPGQGRKRVSAQVPGVCGPRATRQ